ncbi:uncharacterized lipoprotein YddW (UPF0748 family) [Branchiibius hedensis]|uniref:Uncharacterized lipoprotein YddW, UPF0748 family n=1 Tax=Branchiibius hedensis TaxID=672460 RepID=A0A2Y8ZSW3_9MICO|nr:family 10 glycosylhydrolase [Branchiibius hedensis]PWJ26660.1 uncharacterized lipoprotein YddW (UPF0748 family) [Branchiibius hedensis]SSA35471.1 Uncharacterized lipoprotein YddW, UPF0748 family [Branchiibius hedensis]
MDLTRRTAITTAAVAAATAAATGISPAEATHRPRGQRLLPQPKPGTVPTDPHTPKRDFRAYWIATVANIDWPSKPGLTKEQQQRELTDWLDLAEQQGHNAVILQVRPTADAFWPSRFEPWSAWLTGTQGQNPGWDPLKFAVQEAHARNLELHAWFNPFRIAMTEDPGTLIPSHPARQHPEWTIPYGGKLYYNPGIPQVRQFCIDAIMDAVRRYDIDGVHFDDYFYPYPVAGQTFHDEAQFAQYGGGKSLADWRRANINDLVIGLNKAIKRAKPWVQFGVSPFAIWRNKATDPLGSDTTAGAQTYDDLYADTRMWVLREIVDYIVPQVYWSIGFTAADYAKVTDWWAELTSHSRTHLYIGQATYKVAANADPHWNDPGELSSHLQFNTQYPQVEGNIYFSAKSVRADALGASTLLKQQWYSRPALTPATPWLTRRAPRPIRNLRTQGSRLTWLAGSGDTTTYAVYRVVGRPVTSADLADARNLVATVRSSGWVTQWTDPAPVAGASYAVSALDRLSNESAALTS